MNPLAVAFKELARANRLFVGLCSPVLRRPAETPWGDTYESVHVFLKLTPGDCALGLAASKWRPGNWQAMAPGVDSSLSVVLTSGLQVFGCLYAPPNASSQEPVVVSAPECLTTDGYVWQHLYDITPADMSKFSQGSTALIPLTAPPAKPYVSAFTTADLSPLVVTTPVTRMIPPRPSITPRVVMTGGVVTAVFLPPNVLPWADRQYVVIEDALTLGGGAVLTPMVSGGGVSLAVTAGGSGYGVAKIIVRGDGVGAAFTATIESGVIVGVVQVSAGTGYTWCDVVVTAGANSSFAEALSTDHNRALTVDRVILSKYIESLDAAGPQDLTARLFVADVEVKEDRVSGRADTRSLGAKNPAGMTTFSQAGLTGGYSMRMNTHINTVIRFGT